MKKILIFLAFAISAICQAAFTPPTQTATAQYITGLTAAATFTNGVAGGNLTIAVVIVAATTTKTVTGVADDKGDTFTLLDQSTIVNISHTTGVLAYCLNTTAGAKTITATYTGVVTGAITCAEYPLGSGALDVHTVATGSSSSAASGSTTATSHAVELVIGWTTAGSAIITASSPSNDLTTSTPVQAAFSDATTSSTGTQSSSYTFTATNPWVCGVATFFGTAISSGSKTSNLATLGVG